MKFFYFIWYVREVSFIYKADYNLLSPTYKLVERTRDGLSIFGENIYIFYILQIFGILVMLLERTVACCNAGLADFHFFKLFLKWILSKNLEIEIQPRRETWANCTNSFASFLIVYFVFACFDCFRVFFFFGMSEFSENLQTMFPVLIKKIILFGTFSQLTFAVEC